MSADERAETFERDLRLGVHESYIRARRKDHRDGTALVEVRRVVTFPWISCRGSLNRRPRERRRVLWLASVVPAFCSLLFLLPAPPLPVANHWSLRGSRLGK